MANDVERLRSHWGATWADMAQAMAARRLLDSSMAGVGAVLQALDRKESTS